ncbi:MAG: hypothetical protein AAB970_00925 [Patescibacteria group bacterium]
MSFVKRFIEKKQKNKPKFDPAEMESKLENFAGDKKWFAADQLEKAVKNAKSDCAIRLNMNIHRNF